MQLLLICLAPPSAAVMRTPQVRPHDWPLFVRAIERHRVPGLAWRGLQRIDHGMPAHIRHALKTRAHANIAHSMMLLRETLLVVAACADAGVAILPLKGPVLSQQLYADPGLRQSNDIDLLIAAEQLPQVEAVLRVAGFDRLLPAPAFDERRWPFFQRAYHHAQYQRPGGPLLELHWRLHPLANLHPGHIQNLLARSETIAVGGESVPALAPAEQFLYLAGHGARHEWMRLKWLCDLPPLLARMQAGEFQALRRRAAVLGLQRPVAQALQLCESALGWPLPVDLAPAARADAPARGMIQRARSAMLRPESAAPAPARSIGGYWSALRRQMRLKAQLRYKLECLGRVALSPADIEVMRLPPTLGFLYVFLRPILWIRRRFRGT